MTFFNFAGKDASGATNKTVTVLHTEAAEGPRMTFKDIRKILNSSQSTSGASSAAENENWSKEHIYEEIPAAAAARRPLPPLPGSDEAEPRPRHVKKVSNSSCVTVKSQ